MTPAEELRERFTAAPWRERLELAVAWPKVWHRVGRCQTIYYQSDKWRTPGDLRLYYHPTTCSIWEPGKGPRGSKTAPLARPSGELAVLAPCIGWDVHGRGTARCEWGDLLCAWESGRTTYLVVIDPHQGAATAMFEGAKLGVKREGIVG